MKFKFLFLYIVVVGFLTSCDDKADNLGKDIQPKSDLITLGADTFHLSTQTQIYDRIISRPDSFLIGNFMDPMYGFTRADLLAHLYVTKENYSFMNPAVATTAPDSAELKLQLANYNPYFGSPYSQLYLNVYELKDEMKYTPNYYSDIDPAQYVDFSKNWANSFATVVNPANSTQSTILTLKLSKEFVQRFFTTDANVYKTQTSFKDFFKGFYITSSYGSATLLNIQNMQLNYHIHYVYKNNPKDTVPVTLYFPTVGWEKQVVRIQHPERKILDTKEINYVSAPANYYTSVSIPLKKMSARIKTINPHLVVNSASINVNVIDKDSSVLQPTFHPYVTTMLLVEKSAFLSDSIFKNGLTPSNSNIFYANLSKKMISEKKYKYYYTFNGLGKYIQQKIEDRNAGKITDDVLEMALIPVTIKYTSSGAVSEINPATSVQSTAIYSGQNSKIPMKMEVLYSGF